MEDPKTKAVSDKQFIEGVPDSILIILFLLYCTTIGLQVGWKFYEPPINSFVSIMDGLEYMATGMAGGLVFGFISAPVLYFAMRSHVQRCRN